MVEEGPATSRFRRRGWLVVLVGLAISAISSGTLAADESSSIALSATGSPTGDEHVRCELGLDLWDTDPALTWIEGGRVWVRAGSKQACLATTEATALSWSPDGRRVLLDDALVEGEDRWILPVNARPITWEKPFGRRLLTIDPNGEVQTVGPVGSGLPVIASGSGPTIEASLVSSHPDAEHLAVLTDDGEVFLVSSSTGDRASLLKLDVGEQAVQLEFSPDGSRLWILVSSGQGSEARFVDLTPISDFLELPPSSSLVTSSTEPEDPGPDLRFLAVDPMPDSLDLDVGVGAIGRGATSFVLHPAHPDWLVLTEGVCGEATSSLFIAGRSSVEDLPGAGVGFFFGQGHPILATTTAGLGCGQGELWVTTGPSGQALGSPELVAAGVFSADVRDEAGDPWNPQSDPPFA